MAEELQLAPTDEIPSSGVLVFRGKYTGLKDMPSVYLQITVDAAEADKHGFPQVLEELKVMRDSFRQVVFSREDDKIKRREETPTPTPTQGESS